MIPDNKPLNSDQIMRGYSAPDVQAALRNAAVLRWLSLITASPDHSLTARLVEREYSQWSNLPVDEIKEALDHITDQPSLDWLYERYGRDIK